MEKFIKKYQQKRFGPLANFSTEFYNYLLEIGYSSDSANNLTAVLNNLSRWMKIYQMEISELSSEVMEQFLKYRRDAEYTSWLSLKGVLPIINFLLNNKILEKFENKTIKGPLEKILNEYQQYLVNERGCSQSTLPSYNNVVKNFLSKTYGEQIDFKRLNAKIIRKFILNEYQLYGKSTAIMISPLRCFLKWLFLKGKISSPLDSALLCVSRPKSTLPKGIKKEKIQALIQSCDQKTHEGSRAYAILLLMVYLGLRSKEIVEITFNCIDWNCGEIRVRGKGSEEKLPLPEEVGKALSKYILVHRPKIKHENIFLRVKAPYGPIKATAINPFLKKLCNLAGMKPVSAHKLRHSAAIRMLESGSTLSEIAQILRHTNIDTTSIYTRVDQHSLEQVVCEWPGGEHEYLS